MKHKRKHSKTILVRDLTLLFSDLDKSNHKINKKEIREINIILEKLGGKDWIRIKRSIPFS